MGGLFSGPQLGEDQAATHESGISRLCKSIVCAICLAPIVLLGATFLLGWNEKRAVCGSKAIVAGESRVQQVGCTSASEADGELVLLSCDLSKESLRPLSLPGSSDFLVHHVGTGLQVVAEMLQCVESESSTTKKDSVGGGATTVTTYSYSLAWKSGPVDSSAFHKKDSASFWRDCGGENPPWPPSVPSSTRIDATEAQVGPYTIPSSLVRKIPLTAPVLATSTPTGWSVSGSTYLTSRFQVSGNPHGLGQVRVRFLSNDWNRPRFTILGENQGGLIQPWTAPSSWLCSGFTLYDMRKGTVTKQEVFAALGAEASAITWVLRFVGFLMAWLAFSFLFGPLEVALDCIPCVGPCLGDGLAALTCFVSCLPGCACTLGVIGVVWVAMRPLVGVPLLLAFFCIIGGLIGYHLYRKRTQGDVYKAEEPVVQGEFVPGKALDVVPAEPTAP